MKIGLEQFAASLLTLLLAIGLCASPALAQTTDEPADDEPQPTADDAPAAPEAETSPDDGQKEPEGETGGEADGGGPTDDGPLADREPCPWTGSGCIVLAIDLMGEDLTSNLWNSTTPRFVDAVQALAGECVVYGYSNNPDVVDELVTPLGLNGLARDGAFAIDPAPSPQFGHFITEYIAFRNSVNGRPGSADNLVAAGLVDAMVDAFGAHVDDGFEMSIVLVSGHGTPPDRGNCGSWSDYEDIGVPGQIIVSRMGMLRSVYRSTFERVCRQFVYDGSCYGGATAIAGQHLNNMGTDITSDCRDLHYRFINDPTKRAAHDRLVWASGAYGQFYLTFDPVEAKNFLHIAQSVVSSRAEPWRRWDAFLDATEDLVTFHPLAIGDEVNDHDLQFVPQASRYDAPGHGVCGP